MIQYFLFPASFNDSSTIINYYETRLLLSLCSQAILYCSTYPVNLSSKQYYSTGCEPTGGCSTDPDSMKKLHTGILINWEPWISQRDKEIQVVMTVVQWIQEVQVPIDRTRDKIMNSKCRFAMFRAVPQIIWRGNLFGTPIQTKCSAPSPGQVEIPSTPHPQACTILFATRYAYAQDKEM